MSTTGTDLVSDNLICCGIALTGFERLRRVLDARFSILDTRFSILVAGLWSLVTGHWSARRPTLLVTRYLLLVSGNKLVQGIGFQEFGSWNAEGGKQEKKAQGASCRVSASSPLCAMLSALCFIIPQSEFNCLCLPSSVI